MLKGYQEARLTMLLLWPPFPDGLYQDARRPQASDLKEEIMPRVDAM